MINMAARWLLLVAAALLLWQLIVNKDEGARLAAALLLVIVAQLREVFLLRQASEFAAKPKPKGESRKK